MNGLSSGAVVCAVVANSGFGVMVALGTSTVCKGYPLIWVQIPGAAYF